MDLTKIPRELIYRERRSLEDFAAENEVNALFIDNMLNTSCFSCADAKDRALRCFNSAYYICTLIQMCKIRPEWNFAKYCDIAFCNVNGNGVYQAFTLSLVAIFLKHAYYKTKSEKLVNKLDDYLIDHFIGEFDPIRGNYYYIDAYNDLLKDAPEDLLIAEEFAPRKIDRDIFREVDGHGNNWNTFTNYYQKDEVRQFVDMLGKDEEEKHILIELVSNDAQRYYGHSGQYYQETVQPMLEEMDSSISHEYHDLHEQALADAENDLVRNLNGFQPTTSNISNLNEATRQSIEEIVKATIDKYFEDNNATDEEVIKEWNKALAKAEKELKAKIPRFEYDEKNEGLRIVQEEEVDNGRSDYSEKENEYKGKIEELEAEVERLTTMNKAMESQIKRNDENNAWYTVEGDFDNLSEDEKLTQRERLVFFSTILSLELNKKYTNAKKLGAFLKVLCNDNTNTLGPLFSRMKKSEEFSANKAAAEKVKNMLLLIIPEQYRQKEDLTINRIIKSLENNFIEEDE